MHHNIKKQNIFTQNEHTIRIGDFGIWKWNNQKQDLEEILIETPLYISPEEYNSSKIYKI